MNQRLAHSHHPRPVETDGEAANPGPCRIVQGNCTSLRTQVDAVLDIPADVHVLSEVRLGEAGQRELDIKLAKKGF